VFYPVAVGDATPAPIAHKTRDGTATGPATIRVRIAARTDPAQAASPTATTNEDAGIDIDVLANDTDVDASDVLTVTGVTDGANGLVTINADGTVRYVPNANFNGNDSFTYTVTDGHGSWTEIVSVTIAPQPDPIETTADTVNFTVINENRTVEISPLANDSHVDGTLSISGLGAAANGTVVLNANGTVTYTANDGFAGQDTFTYTVLSSSGAETTETVTVNVQTNLAPQPHRVVWPRGEEETPITITPLAWVYDPNGDPLTIVDVEQLSPGAGELTLNADNTITLNPAANFNGGFAFFYTVSDGELESTFYASIWFENTPDAPTGFDDHVGIDPNASTWVNVLANDTDPDLVFGQQEARLMTGVTSVGDTANNATVEIYQNGLLVTPNPGFVGILTFDYTLRDPGGLTSQATATIYVSSLPQLIADGYAILEDSGTHTFDPLANDSDVDAGQVLTITDVTGAVGGVVTIINGGQNISYTPNADYTGVETLTYTVSDGLRETTQTINITVTNTQDTPTAVDDAVTTNEDTAITINVLANDSDPGTAALSIQSADDPANGTITISGNQLIYTPDANFSGEDALTYTVTDGAGGTATATLTITVDAVNDAPIATDITATLNEDGAYNFDPLAGATDVEGANVTLVSVGTPANGTATLNPDGTVNYVPNADFNGTDSFTYVITDGIDETTVTVTLSVTAQNDAPVAADDAVTTQEDTAITVNVLTNDTDVDGDTLTITQVEDPANGSVTFDGTTITYTPDANFFGNESIVYTISDGAGGTTTATLTVTVEAVADAPVTADDTSAGTQDQVQTLDVLANDTDGDGDTLTVTSLNGTEITANELVQLPSGAFLRLTADGAVEFLPLDAYSHLGATETVTETITYTVSDGNGHSTQGTARFTINGTNDLPTSIDFTQPDAAPERSAVSIAAGASFVDVDQTDTLTFSATLADGSPLPSSLSIDAETGLITGTLPENTSGISGADQTITIRVTADDGTDTGTLDVVLTVQNVNDAPTYDAITDTIAVAFNTATTLDLSGLNLTDVDSPVVTLALSVSAGHLQASSVPGVTVTTNGSGLVLTGTTAALNTFLAASVAFADPADQALGQSAILTMALTDGDGASPQTLPPIALDVTGVDDITLTAGTLSDQSGDEDTSIALDFSGITLTDNDTLMITLTGVPSAQLKALAANGLTIARPDADTLTLSGDAADVIAYLAVAGNVSFVPAANLNGDFGPLQVTASGVNGEAPALVGEIGLTVNPVADPILLQGLPSSQNHTEDTPFNPAATLQLVAADFDILNGGAGDYTGSFVDVQARAGENPVFGIADGPNVAAVQLDAATWALQSNGQTFGHFRLMDEAGQQVARFDFDGGTATPTTALVNEALQLLTFQTGLEQASGTQTSRLIWEFGTEEGAPLQTIQSDIAIQFVDDPVSITLPDTPPNAVEEDASILGLAGVALSDPDNIGFFLITLSVDAGALSVAADHGFPLAPSVSSNGDIQFLHYDRAIANQFLQQAITYTPPEDIDAAA
ncbi:MAG: Ig-like domain-containing protein, partial [Ruegeria sp.]